MAKPLSIIAFDKKSARRVDENGFLHVAGCNISKATVNPYLGSEIPGWEQLSLDPKKVYQLHRPAEELTKAASTCNMIPLMDAHIEIDAMKLEDPAIAKHRVGSTGQAGEFKAPYLINDLVITNAGAIAGVDSKEQCELSCAYRYDVVMNPGELDGVAFDGFMTNIRFNHVALVEEGRAGADVMVADSVKGLKAARRLTLDAIRAALKPNPVRVAMATDYVTYLKGHRDSSGRRAPWVVKSESTGKVLWSGPNKGEAVKNLRRIAGHASDSTDPIDEFINQLTEIKAGINKMLKPEANDYAGEALDDCTSAIDSAIHHLLDVKEEAKGDDNPEGINQYTSGGGGASGRSEEAHKASQSAKTSSQHYNAQSLHRDAAAAHRDASQAAKREGNWEKGKEHSKTANAHEEKALYHYSQAVKPQNRDSSVTIEKDDNPEGINQYTGGGGSAKTAAAAKATKIAHAASANAQRMGKSGHGTASRMHAEAAKAHQAAREEALKAGNKEKAAEHLNYRNNHRSTSNSYKSGGRDQSVTLEKDDNPEGINQYTGGGGKGKSATAPVKITPKVAPAYAHEFVKSHPTTIKMTEAAKKIATPVLQKGVRGLEGHIDSVSNMVRGVLQKELSSRGTHDRSLSVTKDIERREDINPKAGTEKYGEVKFADPKNKKYPLDTAAHVRSAASYFGMANNRSHYSKEEQATIQNNIDAAKKKFKIGEYAGSNSTNTRRP